MAKACQCDICGDLYMPYGNLEKPNRIDIMYGYSYTIRALDCCPACMATLQETINMLGDNKDEKD